MKTVGIQHYVNFSGNPLLYFMDFEYFLTFGFNKFESIDSRFNFILYSFRCDAIIVCVLFFYQNVGVMLRP